MLVMLQDLVHHKEYANASLVKAIRRHEAAAQDEELRKTLHHIILANRFWLLLILGLPFTVEEESRIPESLEAIAAQYRETHAQEMEWISQVGEPELTRICGDALHPWPHLFSRPGADAGLHARPWSSRPVRGKTPTVGRYATEHGFHSLAERAAGSRLGVDAAVAHT